MQDEGMKNEGMQDKTREGAASPRAGGTEELLAGPPRLINIGLEAFASEPRRLGARVVQVDWSPPAGADPRLAALLGKMGS